MLRKLDMTDTCATSDMQAIRWITRLKMTERTQQNTSPAAQGGIEYYRLRSEDLGEVLDLLRRTWPQQYGATGCPDFSADYLAWLYTGPDAGRHLLYGGRCNGELVGFKGALYRRIAWKDRIYSAHLATHLTIAPELPFQMRMAAAGRIGRLQPLEGIEEDPGWKKADLLIAFFEQDKNLSRNVRRAAEKAGLQQSSAIFRQAIINPRKARSFEPGATGSLRQPAPADLPGLLEMMQEMAKGGPVWQPEEPALWHHLTAAPHAWVRLVEGDDAPRGFLAGYRLDWLKAGQQTRMFVIEFLAYSDLPALALLLRAALDYCEAEGLRGIVLENATYMPEADRKTAGVIFSPREMNLLLRSTDITLDEIGGFILDIK